MAQQTGNIHLAESFVQRTMYVCLWTSLHDVSLFYAGVQTDHKSGYRVSSYNKVPLFTEA